MQEREKYRKDVDTEYSRTEIMGGNIKREKIKILRTQKYPKTILTFSNASQKNKLHPTQKPTELLEYLIKTYTNENEIIFDGFVGSGSTIIAALNTNRKCIGCELDSEYYNVAKNRIENATININKN